jgi:hypothetical protein
MQPSIRHQNSNCEANPVASQTGETIPDANGLTPVARGNQRSSTFEAAADPSNPRTTGRALSPDPQCATARWRVVSDADELRRSVGSCPDKAGRDVSRMYQTAAS